MGSISAGFYILDPKYSSLSPRTSDLLEEGKFIILFDIYLFLSH